MPTKKQHFVPRVYMKAWETQVETLKEPDKKFNGIYVIKDGSTGDGANRNSVLWKPHLYTINFKYSFMRHRHFLWVDQVLPPSHFSFIVPL